MVSHLSQKTWEGWGIRQLGILPTSGHMNFVDQSDLWLAAVNAYRSGK